MQAAEDYSWTDYDEIVGRILHHVGPETVLDIGAGAGKFGRLARQVCPGAKLTGLEIGEDSIVRHGLRDIYDELIEDDAADLITHHPLARWDVAILGDVIEHMRKSDGVDLLNWLTYRTAYTIIITPEAMPMHRDPWWEGHNAVWTARDFAWHNNWATHRLLQLQLFVLRGYKTHPVSLVEVVAKITADRFERPAHGQMEPIVLEHFCEVDVLQRNTPEGLRDLWWRAF